VRADPWEATAGIHGFGFEKADALARSMGTCPTLIGRRTAAIRSVLTAVCGSDGHAYLPWSEVRQRTLDLLAEQVGGLTLEELEKGWGKGPDREEFEQGLRVLVRKAKLVVEEAGVGEGVEGQAGWTSEGARCYLPFLHAAEVSVRTFVESPLFCRFADCMEIPTDGFSSRQDLEIWTCYVGCLRCIQEAYLTQNVPICERTLVSASTASTASTLPILLD
jgi:hypothetical protein